MSYTKNAAEGLLSDPTAAEIASSNQSERSDNRPSKPVPATIIWTGIKFEWARMVSERTDLTFRDKCIAHYVAWRADDKKLTVWTSRATIAKGCGASERSVDSALASLKAKGLLRGRKSRFGGTVEYTLTMPDPSISQTSATLDANSADVCDIQDAQSRKDVRVNLADVCEPISQTCADNSHKDRHNDRHNEEKKEGNPSDFGVMPSEHGGCHLERDFERKDDDVADVGANSLTSEEREALAAESREREKQYLADFMAENDAMVASGADGLADGVRKAVRRPGLSAERTDAVLSKLPKPVRESVLARHAEGGLTVGGLRRAVHFEEVLF